MPAQFRQIAYTIAALAGYLIPVLVAFGAISTDKSSALINLFAALGAICGTGAAGAAIKVSQQKKDGTFDPTPVIPSPEVLISGLNEVKTHLDGVIQDSQTKAAEAMGNVIALTNDTFKQTTDLFNQIVNKK